MVEEEFCDGEVFWGIDVCGLPFWHGVVGNFSSEAVVKGKKNVGFEDVDGAIFEEVLRGLLTRESVVRVVSGTGELVVEFLPNS